MSEQEPSPAVVDPQSTTTVPLNENGLPVLGFHEGVIDTDYRRAPGINKSSLDLIAKSPATYFFERSNPRPSTPAMVFGSALHCLVLEPEKFEQVYIPDAFPGNRSKEALAWRETRKHAGQIVIRSDGDASDPWDRSDWDKLHLMRDSIMANGVAAALIADAQREVSFWWIDSETKKLCKGRIDGWSPAHSIAFDLKTMSDATWSGFSRSIHDYRYHVQDAFYTDGLNACGKLVGEFVFIVAEKDPPYLTACYMVPFEWRQQGRVQYSQNLQTFKKCMEEDKWPGLEELRELHMPAFARYGRIS